MSWRVIEGDCRTELPRLADGSAHCCVTSPPYWGLRDYGHPDQLGLEKTPEEYTEKLVAVFREVRRVLRDDGTLWLVLGDSYAGGGGYAPNAPCNERRAKGESWGKMNRFSPREGEARTKARPGYTPPGLKPKDLVGIPWRVAFALQADGWYLRSDIIWAKPNPMPESVTDRPTRSHEYIFLLSKSPRYYFDQEAVKEPLAVTNAQRTTDHYDTSKRGPRDAGNSGLDNLAARMRSGQVSHRNVRSVWTVTTQPFPDAHFAVYPPRLIEPCIKAGCLEGGTVLDPFCGTGTTGMVAARLDRSFIGIELSPEYAAMSRRRIDGDAPLFNRPAEGAGGDDQETKP
jgi:DNA modification methylase